MLLTLDGTFLIQILNFVVFWVLLNWLFIAPTRRVIEERQRLIAGRYEEGRSLRGQAALLRAQAEEALDAARKRTGELVRDATSRAAAEADEIERRAATEAAATMQVAHATVAAERSDAVAKQGPFIADLSRAMADRALELDGVA